MTNLVPNTGSVSVIDTATNTVVATILVGNEPVGVAITPDGKHAYVANHNPVDNDGSVSVIDTATNMVVATIRPAAGTFEPSGVAVAPDGKHAYVTSNLSNSVSVIDTATNAVVATVPVGLNPQGGIAFTPDGKFAYVTNAGSSDVNGTVSVIDTATNAVVATVTVGSGPVGVGIIQPPPGVPFLAFNAKLAIDLDHKPNPDAFELLSEFTLGQSSNGIDPVAEPVTLHIGTFAMTIPAGSFTGTGFGPFTFNGKVDGVGLGVRIEPIGTKRYAMKAEALNPNLTGTKNPVPVTLTIGNDSGMTSVKAHIYH